jgi:hypothetical protein
VVAKNRGLCYLGPNWSSGGISFPFPENSEYLSMAVEGDKFIFIRKEAFYESKKGYHNFCAYSNSILCGLGNPSLRGLEISLQDWR